MSPGRSHSHFEDDDEGASRRAAERAKSPLQRWRLAMCSDRDAALAVHGGCHPTCTARAASRADEPLGLASRRGLAAVGHFVTKERREMGVRWGPPNTGDI